MNFIDIIKKKRSGLELTDGEIDFLINGVTSASIPDYQLSAFLMAVCFNSMTAKETAKLTDAMAKSGDILDLSVFGALSADKHSTGGVGDKTTLIVAPIAASLGCKIAKMSGRALGHTGGTVDKLESIPGYKSELTPIEFINQVKDINLAVVGQSGLLAPADKALYALRDVTGTVESPPLIASSIMSKKLAAGAHNIVLDVKVGSGAFMHDIESAKELADMMCDIGKRCGRNVRAALTDMDTPLGYAIGNVLEVKEAIEVLGGRGPDDLREVSITLAGMLVASVRGVSDSEGIELAREALASGTAYKKFVDWIEHQGGDIRYITAPDMFGKATTVLQVVAECDGYIQSLNTELIGLSSTRLGAGRVDKKSKIDPLAGIILKKKTGEKVYPGEIIAELHSSTPELVAEACEIFKSSITYSDSVPERRPLIFEII
ncbi:MAG: thymidine phosphorylase [Ruminococcaceae bacterium]|nr:thymidine phosphorylase [Oscillospiraceae bacterium]